MVILFILMAASVLVDAETWAFLFATIRPENSLVSFQRNFEGDSG